MAHVYSITDGTETIYLNAYSAADPFQASRWLLQTPTPSQMAQEVAGSDSALAPWAYGNVTETIELAIFSDERIASAPPPYTSARRIQRMLDKARLRQQTGMGAKVYIQAYLDVGEGTWRSELLAGRLALKDAPAQMYRPWLDAAFSYTRRAFWEEGNETTLLLYSSEDSSTSPVDVYNNDDATPAATNYVLMGTPVAYPTTIPAPVRIEIKNDAGVSLDWRDFYLCNWTTDEDIIIDPFLHGSEALDGASYVLTTTEAVGWRWNPAILTPARVAQLAGKPYHILVAFSTGASSTSLYLRAVVEAATATGWTSLAQTGLILYSGEGLVDLGVLNLPPGGYDPDGANISLAIKAFRPAGSVTMAVDFVQITPAGDGLFQRVRQIDGSALNGQWVVIDGIEDRAYGVDVVGVHLPIVRKRTLPLLLFPDKYNRVRILFNEATGFTAGRLTEVSASFRARKLDI